MGDIMPFRPAPHVVISTGLVRDVIREAASGVSSIRFDPPARSYFVDFIDRDGSRLSVWDGADHDGALEAANAWGVRIVDETCGRCA